MKKASITSDKRTEGQETNLKRLLEDGAKRTYTLLLKKLDPDKDGMDRLLGNGDQVVNAMVDAGLESARLFTTPNLYVDEEVPSNYTYPPEYQMLPIEEQIKKLAEIFGLSPDDALAYVKTLAVKPLNGGEGRFAIVSDTGIAKLFPNITNPAELFCFGTNLVLEKLESTRRLFHNYRKGQLTVDRYRRHAKTVSAYQKMALEQRGDIWIIDAQLGLGYAGKSVRRARVCFAGNEYGLDPIAKGSIVLTHPNRFVRWEQLHADCAGAEFAPDADGGFSGAPCFRWCGGGGLRFGARYVDDPLEDYGSASGFISQSDPCISNP